MKHDDEEARLRSWLDACATQIVEARDPHDYAMNCAMRWLAHEEAVEREAMRYRDPDMRELVSAAVAALRADLRRPAALRVVVYGLRSRCWHQRDDSGACVRVGRDGVVCGDRLVAGKREIRYVGATSRPLKRLGEHLAGAEGGRSPKDEWIRSLRERPALVPLHEIFVAAERLPSGDWRTDGRDALAEQAWIDALRTRGHRLTNLASAEGIAPRRSA